MIPDGARDTAEVIVVDDVEVVFEFQHSDGKDWTIHNVTIGAVREISHGGESFASKAEMLEWLADFVRTTMQSR